MPRVRPAAATNSRPGGRAMRSCIASTRSARPVVASVARRAAPRREDRIPETRARSSCGFRQRDGGAGLRTALLEPGLGHELRVQVGLDRLGAALGAVARIL